MLKIGHTVTRPGRKSGDPPVTIDVPEELERTPGIEQIPTDVDYYARDYPLESQNIELTADREWAYSHYTKEDLEHRKIHDRLNRPIVAAHRVSGDVEPTAKPVLGKDVAQDIKNKAHELGYADVGITRLDKRYIFKSKKDWVKFPSAICMAHEQEYAPTQTAPSMEAEGPHFGTYRLIGAVGIEMADHIRSLGYHAQIHSPNDNSGAYIPMFVEAGLGQLGANGQLLSPHFGSRARLMIITTDAQVTYDNPIDYGMTAFCNNCQVCVNRCPGRAIPRDRVWWRGVHKNKISYRRCRPVVVQYEGCAVCMRVCPVQRFGMKEVLDHYTETGQVLGKGTHLLEGFNMDGKGYFGPGELPSFDQEFFNLPKGRSEDVAFEELKERIKSGEVTDDENGARALREFKKRIEKYVSRVSTMSRPAPPEEP